MGDSPGERECQSEKERNNEHGHAAPLGLREGKGVIIDVDRRSLSADSVQFSLSSPALTPSCHPFPTSCYIWPSIPPPSFYPLSLPCCILTPHLFLFGFLPYPFFTPSSSFPSSPLPLLLLLSLSPSFSLSLSLQQSLTRIYISSAVIDIFHLPASFPIGCQPASPRQQR